MRKARTGRGPGTFSGRFLPGGPGRRRAPVLVAALSEPVAEDVERDRDQRGEEGEHSPGSRVAAPVFVGVAEDQHREPGREHDCDHEVNRGRVTDAAGHQASSIGPYGRGRHRRFDVQESRSSLGESPVDGSPGSVAQRATAATRPSQRQSPRTSPTIVNVSVAKSSTARTIRARLFAQAGCVCHVSASTAAPNTRRACQTPHRTSATRMGVPVTVETTSHPPTPVVSRTPSRSPHLARQ